jgi:hypothetical protein
VSFKQSAQLERSEVDVPDAIVDLLQADIFTGTWSRPLPTGDFTGCCPLALTLALLGNAVEQPDALRGVVDKSGFPLQIAIASSERRRMLREAP